jgi:hypothetical protein
MMSLIVGLSAVSAGLWGMFHWFDQLLFVIKGVVPAMVLMGGAIAVIAGISTFRRPPKLGDEK